VSNPQFVAFARGLGTIDVAEGWVREHFWYRDENEEILRSPDFMLADMGRVDSTGRVIQLEGDCDDVSTFFAAIGKVLGLPARLVAIRYRADTPNFEHVFTEVYDGGQWRVLDATVRPGTSIQSIEEITENV
jgi:transglutaminase-like putative cysteine protease